MRLDYWIQYVISWTMIEFAVAAPSQQQQLQQQQESSQDLDYWYEQARVALRKRLQYANDRRPHAKNVILFVGDGMGVATVTAARILRGQRQGKQGEEHELAWDAFPAVALAKTYNMDAQVGESSACATALMCGVKTNFETVGLDARGRFENCFSSFSSRVPSLIDWAQESGKSTGIVTNTRITHATPAALYGHSPSRYWEDDSKVPPAARKSCKDLARQLIENDPGRNINVILGGGRRHWMPKVARDPEQTKEEGRRLDGRNLIDDWVRDKKKRGLKAEYVWNKGQLDKINPNHVDYLLEDPESGNATDANDNELWYMQLADGIAGVHHDASESAAGNSNSATAAEFQTTSRESLQSTFLVNSINNGTPMRNNARPISSQVAGIQENVKSVKSVAEALGTAFEISEIKKSISGLEKSVSRILTLLERREIPLYDQNTATDILNLLPLKSVDTVDHLETQLMEQNNMNGLVGILFLVGGESTHKSIYFQMAKLLDSQVSCQYPGIGKKGKIPFFKLKIFQAIQSLFSYSHMDFEVDRDPGPTGDPSLADMTRSALSLLVKNPKGFFLFVEGGRIDHAHHYNNAYRALDETLAMETALLAALSMVNPTETLIVVTSDHSHVLTMGGQATPRGHPILGPDSKVSDIDGQPYSTLLYGNGPGYSTPRTIPINTTTQNEDRNQVHGSAVPRQWATHGGEDVPVYALGPLATTLFTGTFDQSYIPHAIAYSACLGEHAQRCQGVDNYTACIVPEVSSVSAAGAPVVIASSVMADDGARAKSTASAGAKLSYTVCIVIALKFAVT